MRLFLDDPDDGRINCSGSERRICHRVAATVAINKRFFCSFARAVINDSPPTDIVSPLIVLCFSLSNDPFIPVDKAPLDRRRDCRSLCLFVTSLPCMSVFFFTQQASATRSTMFCFYESRNTMLEISAKQERGNLLRQRP